MSTWYRIQLFGITIKAVDVVRTTGLSIVIKSVWAGNTSTRMRRKADQYSEPWEEARTFILKREEAKAQSLRRQLEITNTHLGQIRKMTKPTEVSHDQRQPQEHS